MSAEADFIALLMGVATDPAARGLADDAALFVPPAGRSLVLTHDMLVEGVHFLPADPPADVAWKLVAVNLSDLAGKGARAEGMLLGYTLGPDRAWDAAFVAGLAEVCARYGVPLLGGDTVSGSELGRTFGRTLGLTAIGSVLPDGAPTRGGARVGDDLWVTGTIGDARLGLMLARSGATEPAGLIAAYRRPQPRMRGGETLVPHAHAAMDVSDGLLIDAGRMAAASGCALTIDLDAVPLSAAAIAQAGGGIDARIAAATGGDDYELMLAAAPGRAAQLTILAAVIDLPIRRIGAFAAGSGLSIEASGRPVALPARLGYEHGATRTGGLP